MRARSKRVGLGLVGVLVTAGLVVVGFCPILPKTAVETCENAFNDDENAAALAQAERLAHQPDMVDAMKADLAVNKRDALRYASIAYVLGYSGIDSRENVHRLRVMVDTDPSDSFWKRLATIADPSATDDIVDAIPDRVYDICERHPSQDVLHETLSWRSETSTQEIIDERCVELFLHHPNEVLSAVYGRPDLEGNLCHALCSDVGGDDRIPPVVAKESRSADTRIRSAAIFCEAYGKSHAWRP